MHFFILILVFASSLAAAESPVNWDLTALYATDHDWQVETEKLTKEIPQLAKCKGHLATGDAETKKCLDLYLRLSMRFSRAYGYAHLQETVDFRSSKISQQVQATRDLGAKFDETTAFFGPELKKISPAAMKRFLKLPGANIYGQYLRQIIDQSKHILDPVREELLAKVSPVLFDQDDSIYHKLISSDIAWPTVEVSGQGKQKINVVGYEKLRVSKRRSDRQKIFAAFYETLRQYQDTIGALLAHKVKTDVVMADVRHYKNSLSAALDDQKIPEQVYRTLITEVHNGLPVFQHFLQHEARSLKLKDYSYEDAYVSSVSLDGKFTLQKSKEIIMQALAPLGPDYLAKLKMGFSQNWMDAYPRDGKENGAFMDPSAYEVHPYLLFNLTDDFLAIHTVAHEWGHALNTLYTNAAQPYVNAGNPIYLAEIASQFNEILLDEYLIRTAGSKQEKIYYLEQVLQFIRAGFFRQSQFAEFELALHEYVEKGAGLTGETITKIYTDIFRNYYGHDKKVMNVDEKFGVEWMMVPHFYTSFYVYQYSTCLAAAAYFADQVLQGKPGALDNYIRLLQSGSAKYPDEILRGAGVDLSKPDAYQAVIHRMEWALNQLKELGVD